MTAKEKAKGLRTKFLHLTGDVDTTKKCALLCCDEVINDSIESMNALPQYKHLYIASKLIYEEVKEEIKKQ